MHALKVVEFQGLAPSVFCGMYFADQGAQVVIVARAQSAPVSMPIHKNIMNRNKKCIVIDLKNREHFQLITALLSDADIVIDPYRPGVLEKLKLGPKELYSINKRIILLRVSGYGQSGPLALRPGHDLNYLSISGIIPLINKQGEYQFPSNYLADFASASLGITGTLAALEERKQTGIGKVVDCSLANGCTYLAQHILADQIAERPSSVAVKQLKIGGQTYIYNTKDGRMLSPQQILQFLKGKPYFRSQDGGIEISLVNAIDALDKNTLSNPFSLAQLSNKIKTKGQDDKQILGRLRAKL